MHLLHYLVLYITEEASLSSTDYYKEKLKTILLSERQNVVRCESGLVNCNILLYKKFLKHKVTVSFCFEVRLTFLNTEANNSSTPIADTSVTEVNTTAETPFSTTNAIVGIFYCMAITS